MWSNTRPAKKIINKMYINQALCAIVSQLAAKSFKADCARRIFVLFAVDNKNHGAIIIINKIKCHQTKKKK